jgi:hypothetical protein
MHLSRIAKILGGKAILKTELHSQMDLMELGQRGVSKKALLRRSRDTLRQISSVRMSRITYSTSRRWRLEGRRSSDGRTGSSLG